MSSDFASNTPVMAHTAVPALDAPMGQVERVIDTFVAPRRTFTDILRSASWWLPCVLMILFATLTAYTVDRQVGFDRVNENQIHNSPKTEDAFNQLSPEQRAQRLSLGTKITRYISYGIPVVLLISFAVNALILWACFNFILGARTTFPQVFATCFYAALPYILLNVLTIAVLFFGGNAEAYDYKNPAGTNLAYYLTDASPMLRALLGRLDVIQLWSVGLTAFGMAIVSRKTLLQSAMVVGTLWMIMTLLAVGGAAMS